MSFRALPRVQARGFLGVDWTLAEERVPLGGLVEALGWRITREGLLRSFEGLTAGNALNGTEPLGAVWQTKEDNLVVFSIGVPTGNTVSVQEVGKGLGAPGAATTFLTSAGTAGGAMVLSPVNMAELIFWALASSNEPGLGSARDGLRHWNGSAITLLKSVDTDLDNDGDATDELKFRGIAKYQGHLIGWGFGDEAGTGNEETADLGPDRPEIMRWSHLGQPLKWRPEDWIMIGTRGVAILSVVEAFGRAVVLKPEGVWLLFGNLERSQPALEILQADTGRATGIVGPAAAAVADGAVYWLSPSGPMRWRGGPTAEYIGRGVEASLTASERTSTAFVVVAPELEAVLFCRPVLGGGGVTSVKIWVWDLVGDRWAGRTVIATAGFYAYRASTVPDANGAPRVAWGHLQVFEDQGDVAGGATVGVLTTSEVELAGGDEAIVRGLLLEGDFDLHDGYLDIEVRFAGDTTHLAGALTVTHRLYIAASAPGGASAGDIWLDTSLVAGEQITAVTKHFDGTTWRTIMGLPLGYVRLPLNQRARTARAKISHTSVTQDHKHVLRGFAFQAKPVRRAA